MICRPTRICIIGGGIAGLAAAVAFSRIGLRPEVYEKSSALRELGTGIILWSNAFKSLRELGVAEAVQRQSSVIQRYEISTSAGRMIGFIPLSAKDRERGAISVCIDRERLLKILASSLDDMVIHCGHQLSRLTQERHDTVAIFENGQRKAADLLIGADGLNSQVRELLHGHSTPRYAGCCCWRGMSPVQNSLTQGGTAREVWGHGLALAHFAAAISIPFGMRT